MTTHEEARALVRRMQECFNSRRFDDADGLSTPDCFSHPLGATGVEAGKQAWRMVTARFPGMRVVAEDILVDGDKIAVRSAVAGIAIPDGGRSPCCSRSSASTAGGSLSRGGPARDFRPPPARRKSSAKPGNRSWQPAEAGPMHRIARCGLPAAGLMTAAAGVA